MSSRATRIGFVFLFILTLSFALVPHKVSAVSKPTSPLYGVTMVSIDQLESSIDALRALPEKMTTRIVFDEYQPPSNYLHAVEEIHKVSYVMGEILDSFYVGEYSVQAYLARTAQYLALLGDQVDIWEIGNEINGEWLGDSQDVILKMTGAYNIIKQSGGIAALTLYYNEDCWTYPEEEMFGWAEDKIPADMKNNLDYIFISYYEEDCNNLRPDWPGVFARLGSLFPNSKLGFGEVGTRIFSEKADYLDRYYRLKIDQENYIGGYFWWYFVQDMVPKTRPLWKTLDRAIRATAPEMPLRGAMIPVLELLIN